MRDIVSRKTVSGKSMVYFLRRFAKFGTVWDIAVFFLYVMIVIGVTWPLVDNLNRMMPGLGNDGGDGFIFIWNYWWVKKQLFVGNLFDTNYIFYPLGVNLVFHTLILGQVLFGLLWGSWLPIEIVFNLSFMLSMLLAAVFAYLLVRDLWHSRWGGWLGGLIFGFSPYVLAQAKGHFNLTVIWPFPAIGWLWFRGVKKNSIIYFVLVGLVLAFLCLNDWQYFIFGLVLYVCLLFYSLLYSSGKKILIFYFWLIGLLVAGVIFVPLLIKTLVVSGDYLPTALLSEVKYWSADLLSFLLPGNNNIFLGGIGTYFRDKFFLGGIENQLYFGWVVICLLFLSFGWKKEKEDRQIYFWQGMVILFILLALGPLLKIAGKTDFLLNDLHFNIALPYMILYRIPFLNIARVPARFTVLVMLCFSVVVGWVIKKIEWGITKKFGKYSFWSSLLFLIIFIFIVLGVGAEYWNWPIKMQNLSIPNIYREIKSDPDESTVLELPLWWSSGHRSLGEQKTIIQYWQTYHEKRILNGSVSRVPDGAFDYYLQKPGIKYLIDVEKNFLENEDKEKLLVEKIWKDELGIKYIVVHKKYFSGESIGKIRDYLEDILGLKVWYEDEGEIGYKI